jgi:hypothetical protein
MRKALFAVAILLVSSTQIARADVTAGSAPADEYFGPYKQSVLEIRNRLNDYDALDPRSMIDPSVSGYLDHLQVAIRDWQSKYPRDPWLPRIWGHLIRGYWRAGQSSSRPGMAALSTMRTAFPDSPETNRTVALVYGSNRALDAVAQDRPEVQAYVPPQPSYYQPPVYQQQAYVPSYAQPDPYQEPEDQQPAYQQPVYQQPAYQPAYQQPTYQQSTYRESTYQRSTYQRSTYQQPATEEAPAYSAPAYDDGSHDTATLQESIPAQVAAGDQTTADDSPDDAPTPPPMR